MPRWRSSPSGDPCPRPARIPCPGYGSSASGRTRSTPGARPSSWGVPPPATTGRRCSSCRARRRPRAPGCSSPGVPRHGWWWCPRPKRRPDFRSPWPTSGAPWSRPSWSSATAEVSDRHGRRTTGPWAAPACRRSEIAASISSGSATVSSSMLLQISRRRGRYSCTLSVGCRGTRRPSCRSTARRIGPAFSRPRPAGRKLLEISWVASAAVRAVVPGILIWPYGRGITVSGQEQLPDPTP